MLAGESLSISSEQAHSSGGRRHHWCANSIHFRRDGFGQFRLEHDRVATKLGGDLRRMPGRDVQDDLFDVDGDPLDVFLHMCQRNQLLQLAPEFQLLDLSIEDSPRRRRLMCWNLA